MVNALYPELMSWPDVSLRRMFGADCFLSRGRMFAFAFKDGVVTKVAKDRYRDALAVPGAAPFESRPGLIFGRWVRFPSLDRASSKDAESLISWLRLAYEAVLTEPPRRRKAKARSFREQR